MAETRFNAAKGGGLGSCFAMSGGRVAAGVWFAGGDFAAVMAVPLAVSVLRAGIENLSHNLCFWALLALITVALIHSHGGYRLPADGDRQTRVAIYSFLATSAAMLSLACLLGHGHILLRRWTAFDLGFTPALIFAVRARITAPLAAVAPPPAAGPVVICYDHCPRGLAQALQDQALPPGITGVLFLSEPAAARSAIPWPVLAGLPALLALLRAGRVQDIVFIHHAQLDLLNGAIREELLAELLAHPARIWLAFDLAPALPGILKTQSSTCKLVPIVTGDLVSSRNLPKRLFDLAAATLLTILCSPLLAVIACAVRLSGPGPVIFRQTRIGAQGRPFTVLKFRTMAAAPASPFAQATPADPRVTRIGRILRRTSLDELLQLLNVISGEMSLVGPRPHAPETQVEGIDFEQAIRLYRLRHRVKPGITGLAQIRGQRGATSELRMLEQRLASDLEYIQSWSLWLDISIMLNTLPTVFAQTNAY